ncbi:TPA: DNA methyltransferase [Pseudomonas aeruginosa]
MKPLDIHDEWLSLIEVSGPFLAAPVLKHVFSTGLPAVEPRIRQYLRQAYDEWCEARENDDPRFAELHRAWIHEVLARGLEYDETDSGELLRRGERIPLEQRVTLPEHGVTLEPDYALVSGGKSRLLVQIYSAGTDLQASLKLDGWSASPAERMERLCRASGCRLGLVTDGERWMLVDAPVGAVSTFASWYARLWGQERLTLQAFLTLLGIRRFFGPDDESLPSMLDESLQHQEEVTDALGEQVRRAVEVLIQALGKEDRERSGALLQGVEPTELYEAGLTIMMRLVFLLAAEERGLLLMGEEAYESNYAISTLRMQLRQETEEVLERRNDAWSRLLATFRAVYGGIEHEALRLPALGGSLFDPDRFPFLEGRAKGSDWKIDSARPLPIDNRTVLLLLEAIQQYEGRTLSYRALDVEQIGYVYEGLLERTVRRTERVTVELAGGKGAKKTLYGLDELEALRLQGDEALADALSGADAIKRGAGPIRKDLERSVDAAQANRLLTACAGDESLRDRALPFLNLLRTDPWGYPLIYPEGAFIVTTGSDRRETGTHYTPKSLTETIVDETLTPIVYKGPAEGAPREQWVLKPPAELLDLKICDPAMGSGAFLVQTCRWLADRLVEAWSKVEYTGKAVSVDGEILDAPDVNESLPRDAEGRTVIARRLIAERCLYGVDLNPLAVELAKLSIWLVTLAKGRPFGFLDHNLRCGDSLLGIHRLDQLIELDMMANAKGQQRLFGKNIEKAVCEAIELRQRLRRMPIRDIHDVEAMARLDADARCHLDIPERIADALIGVTLSSEGNQLGSEKALSVLAIQAGQAIDGNQEAINAINNIAANGLSHDLPSERGCRKPFHWPLEFPEAFQGNSKGFDAFVGNPPFLGGRRQRSALGGSYQIYLSQIIGGGGSINADLCAFFFRRSGQLIKQIGAIGLIATNSIGQGATREMGLEPLCDSGFTIYRAISNFEWPGDAGVTVSVAWLYKGAWTSPSHLDGQKVEVISSYLSSADTGGWSPQELSENSDLAFQGSNVLGAGFILSKEQATSLIERDGKNAVVVLPFIRGEDFNSTPDQQALKWIINFFDWPLDRKVSKDTKNPVASDFPICLEIVEKLVKPKREAAKRKAYRERWWQYAERCGSLYSRIANLNRVIFQASPSKHVCFGFAQSGAVYSGPHTIIASEDVSDLALMQSTIHTEWAWQFCSTMRNSGIRYNPSDFRKFPRPVNLDGMSSIAEEFSMLRQSVMKDRSYGLTALYNDYHCADEQSPGIKSLRGKQLEVDQKIFDAYGWVDLQPILEFRESKQGVRYTFPKEISEEITRRLVALNKSRHEAELLLENASSSKAGKRSNRLKLPPTEPLFNDLFGDDEA